MALGLGLGEELLRLRGGEGRQARQPDPKVLQTHPALAFGVELLDKDLLGHGFHIRLAQGLAKVDSAAVARRAVPAGLLRVGPLKGSGQKPALSTAVRVRARRRDEVLHVAEEHDAFHALGRLHHPEHVLLRPRVRQHPTGAHLGDGAGEGPEDAGEAVEGVREGRRHVAPVGPRARVLFDERRQDQGPDGELDGQVDEVEPEQRHEQGRPVRLAPVHLELAEGRAAAEPHLPSGSVLGVGGDGSPHGRGAPRPAAVAGGAFVAEGPASPARPG
mmetsp:Transcript_9418/g.21339  ORF Transcript_9418/g.21339 Transcript_9418/m.21339 type:complete len:274 (+) Transcript_9418:1031-1852(+)